MATKPATYYPWAIHDLTEDIIVNNAAYTVPNKTAPSSEFTEGGILYDRGVPVQYWNYQWNGLFRWWSHLDQRLSLGDIYETTGDGGAPTEAEINALLGGTWELLGTTTYSVYVFKKVS